MADNVTKRLNKVLTELNISMERAVEFLSKKGIEIASDPNTKITGEVYQILENGFEQDRSKKLKIEEVNQAKREEKQRVAKEKEESKVVEQQQMSITKAEVAPSQPVAAAKPVPQATLVQEVIRAKADPLPAFKTLGKIDLDAPRKKEIPQQKVVAAQPVEKQPSADVKPVEKQPEIAPKSAAVDSESVAEPERIETKYQKLDGPKTIGKIDLTQFNRPTRPDPKKDAASGVDANKKRKRKRTEKVSVGGSAAPRTGAAPGNSGNRPARPGGAAPGNSGNRPARPGAPARPGVKHFDKVEPTEAEISKQIKETLDKLTSKGTKSKASRYRRDKREERRHQLQRDIEQAEVDSKIIQVTEFLTVSEFATMMDVPVTKVISSCMQLGIMATMNQRLDAETLSVVADEFGYEIEFVNEDIEEAVHDTPDKEEDLQPRAPIVTVMGHVDHGKTSLLDYVRRANVIAGEAGGITQHIAAYSVKLETGNTITFLDTPGHEAFTAMRARGAQVTDIAIIVIAADSDVMPQTKEAISHAQAAGVPMIFAINKVDLPTANPDKIRESLAQMNLLVEDWGGKLQCQEISAKKGINVDKLLEKVLLEAEMLELKANPDKQASGTVIEASLDKGRGYVTTVLVQNGTLKIGDYLLAGQYSGKVKAMFDERGNKLDKAHPAKPVLVLGLDGSPQAGDKFNVFEDEREAKQIAVRRTQLRRELNVRTSKHITLDEIGRRIAIGDFKELNIIIKGDVDGSVEALTDSLQKLSTEKIHINVLFRGVGAITESDVLLASASEAIIIGFNVRPSGNAKKLAETEQIDIRTYSIIYDAINEVRDAMEGMLAPTFKEEVTSEVEIRQVYKISKVGTVAGCMVLEGKISRNSKIRIIREGVVVHEGSLESLKRFKDDVKEVSKGYECGLNIEKFNDIREGDIIEGFQMVEVKPKL